MDTLDARSEYLEAKDQEEFDVFYYSAFKELLGQTATVLARNTRLKGTLERIATHPTQCLVSNETGCFRFYEGDVKRIDVDEDGTPLVVLVGA